MTSKYIQIHNGLIVEYRYTSTVNPEEHLPSEYGVEIVKDAQNKINYFFNTPDNLVNTTNVRDYSSIQLDDKTFVSLNRDLPLQYLDYDSNLTNLEDVEINDFPPTYTIKYDEIRIHIASNFNFDDKEALLFKFDITRRDEKDIVLSTITYRKSDDYAVLNPTPITLGERIYNRYIRVKVPSLYYLLQENKLDDNLTFRLTEQLGYISTSKINVSYYTVNDIRKENSFSYYDVILQNRAAFNYKDDYELLMARIKESDQGDYYEVYGEFNGIIYEDFINRLNSQPDSDYSVFHELTVNEQIAGNFIETARQITLQTSNFDKPIKFRPIIENASQAVAYSISYVLRLINSVDNSQILKTAQITSYDTKKYGRNLKRINLPLPHVVDKVYNKVEKVDYNTSSYASNDRFLSANIVQKEYINVFNERVNIVLSLSKVDNSSNITAKSVIDGEEDIITYYDNEAYINISPFDDYIMFSLYKKVKSDLVPINLKVYGDIYINFKENTDEIKIKEYVNNNTIAENQRVFKISKEDSTKLSNYTNKKFYITHMLENDDGTSDESVIYTGFFSLT